MTAGGVRAWYPGLAKPPFTPAPWIFAPAWTLLYLMMGFAAYLVWRDGLAQPGARAALLAFLAQLVLNGLWSILFFGLRSPGLAFGEITLLWAAIGLTAILFYRQSTTAGLLMLPYWAWVTFAGVLNFSIWRLNS